MKQLRALLDQQAKLFEKGGKLEKLYPLYEALDSFLYTPGETAHSSSFVRDAIDLKRTMVTVVMALIPATLMALYNTGYQAHLVLQQGFAESQGFHQALFALTGLAHDPSSIISNMVYGAIFFLPVYFVTIAVGGFWEVLFAIVRKHEVNEGFLVTSLLFPLTLPPTIPLWQVAVGITFGVVIGKEIYGGTGRNLLNPALTARVFLFFSYPAQISGDKVWTITDKRVK